MVKEMSHWRWIGNGGGPDDAEKFSKALKEMGWYSYWVRAERDE
jgi:hypothetical protein